MLQKILLVSHYSKKRMKRNALQVSWWVISGSLIKVLSHEWVVRHILDQIQKRYTYQIYSHLLSHRMKKKTRPHRSGVNKTFWWRSRTPKYLYRKMIRLKTWTVKSLIFAAEMYTHNNLILGRIKSLHLNLRTAR